MSALSRLGMTPFGLKNLGNVATAPNAYTRLRLNTQALVCLFDGFLQCTKLFEGELDDAPLACTRVVAAHVLNPNAKGHNRY